MCPKHWDRSFIYIISFDCQVSSVITALLPSETGSETQGHFPEVTWGLHHSGLRAQPLSHSAQQGWLGPSGA